MLDFLTTLNKGPLACFLGVTGAKAFSCSAIRFTLGFERFSSESTTFSRRNVCPPFSRSMVVRVASLDANAWVDSLRESLREPAGSTSRD